MSDRIEIPHFSLSPRVLTLYSTVEGHFATDLQRKTFENLKDNKNKYNELSAHSIKRLRRSINWLIYITKQKTITGKQIITKSQDFTTEYEKGNKFSSSVAYKLAMITLTLPSVQVHSDEQIKKDCLNQFLIEIKKQFSVKDYIWKAEKQENNNIHFHILINKYIHHAKIRSIWNRILEKLDYISTYQKNMQEYYKNGFQVSSYKNDKRSIEVQKIAYEKGKAENWQNPNSTDIHSLYKVRNAGAYITKYIAKGVTKTERNSTIKQLRDANKEIKKRITEIEKQVCFYNDNDKEKKRLQNEIDSFEKQLSDNCNALDKLLMSGVSGRIWGQSQSLSKLKPFIQVESWENIPQINVVAQKAEFRIDNKIGSRSIHSYIFDVQNFPILNAYLDFHLHKNSDN